MADSVTMEISGLKELADKMRAMGPDINRKVLRSAVGAAAGLVRDQAKATNPDDTGRTDRALYAKFIKEKSADHQVTYYVGVRSGKGERKKNRDAWYWRLVEFGTAKLPARPFMRPAFESQKMKALDLIRERIARRLKYFERKK
jgi:HK97 gp10 family phage protein